MQGYYKIEFWPFSEQGDLRSHVEVVIEKTGMDEKFVYFNAVIKMVAGEHSDDSWYGKSFDFKFDVDGFGRTVDGFGRTKDIPNEWIVQKTFRAEILRNEKFSMELTCLDPA